MILEGCIVHKNSGNAGVRPEGQTVMLHSSMHIHDRRPKTQAPAGGTAGRTLKGKARA